MVSGLARRLQQSDRAVDCRGAQVHVPLRRAQIRVAGQFLDRPRPKVTARTVNYELRCLTTFFMWARRQNLIFVNPASAIEKFRVPRRALARFLTSGQLQKLFAACDERERRLYQTFFLSGMRKGALER